MFRKLDKQDESTPPEGREDQWEEESVHSFYVLIHVLITLNLKP